MQPMLGSISGVRESVLSFWQAHAVEFYGELRDCFEKLPDHESSLPYLWILAASLS